MKNRNAIHYDKLYASEKVVFGEGKPESLVIRALDHLRSGKVLDIGGGEGRNAVFMAENGFDVEVVDVSKVGIKKIQDRAKELGINIKTKVADITEIEFGNYDIIILSFVLHVIRRDKAVQLLRRVMEHTNPGGLNIVIGFTKKGDFFKDNPNVKSYYLDLEELKKIYSHWEIIEYVERNTKARQTKTNGDPMFNTTAFLLAQKQ